MGVAHYTLDGNLERLTGALPKKSAGEETSCRDDFAGLKIRAHESMKDVKEEPWFPFRLW